MKVKNSVFQYNHENNCFYEALGISEEMNDFCVEVIFFSTFSNYLLRLELFGEDDNAPSSLSTITGDLEKSLIYVQNEIEKDYLLLIFRKYHDLALDAIAKYKFIEQASDVEKKKFMLMLEMVVVKMKEEEEKKNEKDTFINPLEVFKKISNVKKAKYNFERYLELNSVSDGNDTSFISFTDVTE